MDTSPIVTAAWITGGCAVIVATIQITHAWLKRRGAEHEHTTATDDTDRRLAEQRVERALDELKTAAQLAADRLHAIEERELAILRRLDELARAAVDGPRGDGSGPVPARGGRGGPRPA